MPELDVLFISGAPRSGTTLLGMVLGQLPGFCDVGELWALWRPAFAQGDLCGCGRPVNTCAFWLEVVTKALGPSYETEGSAMGRLHRQHLGTLGAPPVWRYARGARRPELDIYAHSLANHYRAIAEVAGASTIVDSSKMASDALLASTLPGIRLRVLHLIRDPRGIAWSWRKQVRQPGPDGRELDRHGAMATAARWNAYNLFAEALVAPQLGEDFRRLRYEDMLTNPMGTLSDVATWAGADPGALPLAGNPTTLSLSRATHPVWGNPVRTSTGQVTLRADTEWQQRLPVAQKLAVTAATIPGLLRYHYPIASSSSEGRTG